MTETIKLPVYYNPDRRNARYGSLEELKELLLYKRIVEWDKEFLLLEDGTKVTIETSESDCCAGAGGEFQSVTLDAVITDVKIGEQAREEDDFGTTTSTNCEKNRQALVNCVLAQLGSRMALSRLKMKTVRLPISSSLGGVGVIISRFTLTT